MYLIQLLLPLYDNDGRTLPKELFAEVRGELVERFGGLTAFTRAPVQGLWLEEGDRAVQDDSVIYEVMAQRLDREWWQRYRSALEERFRQKQLVVRAHRISLL